MISIKNGMKFIVPVTVMILTFSIASCDSSKGSDDNKLLLLLLGPKRQATTTAIRVYGQGGSFTSFAFNNGGVSASSLYKPSSIALDGSGNLYVVDYFNHRVLYFPSGSTTATRVYGQPDFSSNTANNGGRSATSLYYPIYLAVDRSGNLYIADFANNRVLYYPSGSTTATRVYGQGGNFGTGAVNMGGSVSESTLDHPFGVAVDGSGNLYVADNGSNRVLYYPSGSTTATQVYGQGGDFTTATINKGGISPSSLNSPSGVTVDMIGNLYVADVSNNRVLFYPSGSTTATRVYGQGGNFWTGAVNMGGAVSESTLNTPESVAVDGDGNLYVADYNNNRVLYYPSGITTPTRVYGQDGSFVTGTQNNGGISAKSLYLPNGVTVDGNGYLYVADISNNRVLYY